MALGTLMIINIVLVIVAVGLQVLLCELPTTLKGSGFKA